MSDKTRNIEWRQRDNIARDGDTITQVLVITTDTIVLTHPFVKLDSSAGAVTALALPNGKPGQILVIQSIDAANMDVIPVTAHGWSALDLDVIGDTAVLLYANDTAGWVILSLYSVAANGQPSYTFA